MLFFALLFYFILLFYIKFENLYLYQNKPRPKGVVWCGVCYFWKKRRVCLEFSCLLRLC
jgi:hypothetical protein